MKNDNLLRVGTSSWSSDDWKTAGFYDAQMEPRDYLGYYATHFDCVEVDSSFYRAPSAALCARWDKVVPDEFRFSLKVPREITHDKVLEGCEESWDAFLKAVALLGQKLAFLVLQFGYFNRSSACPTLGEFLRRLEGFLGRAPAPCPLVVEVRNKAWLGKDLLGYLRDRKVILAIAHQEWMPAPLALWEKHGPDLLTGPAAYVRLLGERKRIEAMTKTWEKLVIDRTQETRDAILVIQGILARGRIPIYVLLNNHFGGYAVASAELFRKLWAEAAEQP